LIDLAASQEICCPLAKKKSSNGVRIFIRMKLTGSIAQENFKFNN